MSSPVGRERLQAIEDRAVDEIVELTLGIAEQMVDENGLAYGDEELSEPAEFVAFYIDLRERGVLEHLITIAPRHAERLRRRFEREAAGVLLGERT